MIMLFKKERKSAQTFIEYTLLLGIIVGVFMAMAPLIKRGTQSMVKIVADQVGNQIDADQPGGVMGHLVNSSSTMSISSRNRKLENPGQSGQEYNDRVDQYGQFVTNLGFTKK